MQVKVKGRGGRGKKKQKERKEIRGQVIERKKKVRKGEKGKNREEK